MRNAVIVALLLVATPIAWQPLQACGDKLLMVGRSMKFRQAYAAVHPGNILIYARPGTSAKAAIRDPQFQKMLRQAGHTVSVIEDAALLEQAFRTVAIDIVMADVVEAPRLEALAAASPAHPLIVPVLFPSKAPELKQLLTQYICKLKDSDRPIRYLDVIEDTMKSRVAAARPRKG